DLGPAAPDLGERILEPVRNIDTGSMRGARHGILDRLPPAFGYSAKNEPTFAGVNVHLKIDRSEDWFMQFLEGCGEHLEDRGARLGVLSGYNTQQCRTLRLACSLIDDDCRLPLTFVDRFRPAHYG